LSLSQSQLAKARTLQRVIAPDQYGGDGRCSMFGCKRQTPRALGNGLSGLHCKYHLQYKARHGSTWRKSLTALELQPYRKASRTWLQAHAANPMVQRAVAEIESLLASSGPWQPAHQLKGMKPKDRARVALARLRVKGVAPERLLHVYLSVVTTLQSINSVDRSEEFRLVQIAKPIHRLASGYHIQGVKLAKGSPLKVHFYPETRGLVLGHMGRMIENACQTGVDRHDIEEVLKLTHAM
jgi:hypothetical protein